MGSKFDFHKVLAKYYIKWFEDCHESALYCRARNDDVKAQGYLKDAETYLTIIMENWDAIEFFSVNDRAHLIERALPKEFQGYK